MWACASQDLTPDAPTRVRRARASHARHKPRRALARRYEGHFVPQMEATSKTPAARSSGRAAEHDTHTSGTAARRRLRRSSFGAPVTYGATAAEGPPVLARTGSAATRPHGHGGHAARAGRHRRNSHSMVGNLSHGASKP